MSNGVTVELGWPHPYLWPNSGTDWHRMAIWRVKKAAREEANWSVRIAKNRNWKPDPAARFDLHIICHPIKLPQGGGTPPDQQNVIAALKAHFDGFADALNVNDRQFNAPTLEFGERKPNGKIMVRVTQC